MLPGQLAEILGKALNGDALARNSLHDFLLEHGEDAAAARLPTVLMLDDLERLESPELLHPRGYAVFVEDFEVFVRTAGPHPHTMRVEVFNMYGGPVLVEYWSHTSTESAARDFAVMIARVREAIESGRLTADGEDNGRQYEAYGNEDNAAEVSAAAMPVSELFGITDEICSRVSAAMGYDVGLDAILDAAREYYTTQTPELLLRLECDARELVSRGGRGVDLAERIDRIRIVLASRDAAAE